MKTYRITLTAVSPIRIGGMDEPLGGVDNPIAMVGDRMCIPGPSLKGAYRYQLERYLFEQCRNEDSEDGWENLCPCLASPNPSDAEKGSAPRYRKEACKIDGNSICPVCYILGAQGLVGFVSVPFLFAEKQSRPQTLYSARIDRATATVAKGANRSYQFAAPGTQFTGNVTVDLETPSGWTFGKPRRVKEGQVDLWLTCEPFKDKSQEQILEELVVKRLQSIKMIGGYKSKGFGEVKVEITEQ